MLGLTGCSAFRRHRQPAPPPTVRYVLGNPYRAGGIWRYPRARFDLEETGIAMPLTGTDGTLADGAPFDPTALIAAHPTLQLPCVVEVANLETGRVVEVRVDGRGPDAPGRVLALSPRALALLGPGSEAGVLRVRLRVLEGPSRALADALAPDRERLAVQTAPTGPVREETLPPPAGVTARPGAVSAGAARAPVTTRGAPPVVPLHLPETVRAEPVRLTRLFLDLGAFSRREYALLLARRLGGLGATVDTNYAGAPDRPFRVRIGPFATVAEADATLDRTLAAGVVDARIVVDEG